MWSNGPPNRYDYNVSCFSIAGMLFLIMSFVYKHYMSNTKVILICMVPINTTCAILLPKASRSPPPFRRLCLQPFSLIAHQN